jgi:hypothetical protein
MAIAVPDGDYDTRVTSARVPADTDPSTVQGAISSWFQ